MDLLPNFHQSRLFILLAPQGTPAIPFGDIRSDWKLYENILDEMQKFRGKVYVSERNLIRAELTAEGRHYQAVDRKSWHLLTLNEKGSVAACGRLVFYPRNADFSDLLVSHSALAHSDDWRQTFRKEIEAQIRWAKRCRARFAELGGWAIGRELRCTTEAVRMVLAGFALGQLLGGVIGVSTVNIGHHSSSILRRIGGTPLMAGPIPFPAFYEPQYRAEVEVLRFDAFRPNPRYAEHIRQCREALENVMVISSEYLPAECEEKNSNQTVPIHTRHSTKAEFLTTFS